MYSFFILALQKNLIFKIAVLDRLLPQPILMDSYSNPPLLKCDLQNQAHSLGPNLGARGVEEKYICSFTTFV